MSISTLRVLNGFHFTSSSEELDPDKSRTFLVLHHEIQSQSATTDYRDADLKRKASALSENGTYCGCCVKDESRRLLDKAILSAYLESDLHKQKSKTSNFLTRQKYGTSCYAIILFSPGLSFTESHCVPYRTI